MALPVRRYFRLTCRTTAVECERDPPVAVIVNVKLPTFVAEVVVTVRSTSRSVAG